MKIILLLLCSILFFHVPAESTAASVKTTRQTVAADMAKKLTPKKYIFTPIPASVSNVTCQNFTLHFSNICTRADLRTYSVTLKQGAETYPCKLVQVNDNGTFAEYVPCQTLPTGIYFLQGFPKIRFTIVSSSISQAAPGIDTPPGEHPTAAPMPGTSVPGGLVQPPFAGYSYTLTARTKKHEKISHALVEIYLNEQCILSGETDNNGVYHTNNNVFQPHNVYTVRIYKPVPAFQSSTLPETDKENLSSLSFEPQELSLRFSNTHSMEQNVTLYEPPKTSYLPITICWSLDAWNALASEHPHVQVSLWNVDKRICLLKQNYIPSITAMTASIPFFEKEQLRLPSGSYHLRISITDSADAQRENLPATLEYPVKLLHGEWITPVIINLP